MNVLKFLQFLLNLNFWKNHFRLYTVIMYDAKRVRNRRIIIVSTEFVIMITAFYILLKA